MITFLRGEVAAINESRLVLDVNGVGFQITVSARDAAVMPLPGEEVRIHTYMSVREDAISLYGFLEEEDLELYKLLIGVSGIGPKAAMGILSAMSADVLRMAVWSDDYRTISKAPGIGVKTARKLILELKDRIPPEKMLHIPDEDQAGSAKDPVFEANKEEAVQILTALGYSRMEAVKAVRGARLTPDMDADRILTAALAEH